MIREYGYEYDASLDRSLWQKTQGQTAKEPLWGALCLRSGRDALKAVAREYQPTTVFLPALACDSMVLPFEMYGHTVEYYRLTEDYKIDLPYLEARLPKQTALFLYMDYFGLPAIREDELAGLRERYPALVFIEDRTHNLIRENQRSFVPDYTIASLRKWIAVPDGGLLWTKAPLKHTEFAEDTAFCNERLRAQCMRREFFSTGDPDTKTAYRKIFSTVSQIMDGDKAPSRMSAYSYYIARQTRWDDVRRIRQKNAERLIAVLKDAGVKWIQPETGQSDLYVAFKIQNRENLQNKLSAEGIFNTVIWPLNERQRQVCAVAKETEQTMLAAPCDQRYTVRDMEYIGQEMVRIFRE